METITRDDGYVQVTYNGWPLYYVASDDNPGDTNGQYGTWFVVSIHGGPIQRNAAVNVAEQADLGEILVDHSGRSLYLFTDDEADTSSCTGGCALTWPPLLTVGDPAAGDGASADLLRTTTRDDGSVQVTYNGAPLYFFSGDDKPGDANGQDVGNVWFVVSVHVGPIQNEADLSLTKEADPDPVVAGSQLTYTISVTNNSTSTIATGVKVTDTLPPEVSFESATEGCDESAGIVTCDLGDLGVIQTVEVTIVVTVDSSARDAITNTATVEGDQIDPDLTNNSDTEETAVTPIPCTLDITLGYADGSLTMDFEVGTPEPATWSMWVVIPGTGVFSVWSLPLPVVDPSVFPTLSFPFPSIGTVGFFTALITSEGIICSDWATVDTGAPSSAVPSISELRELLPGPSVALPNN
ncbi:MAG: DUF11 domain-containing protein [Chloroflexi bacterium]|nr:DUF11 domain-containing protein [Chloroflexota bacterium]